MKLWFITEFEFNVTMKTIFKRGYESIPDSDGPSYWCFILRKRAGIDKMDYRLFRRKYLLGCLGNLGEVSRATTLLSLYPDSFLLLLFLSARVLFSLAGYARNHFSTFWTLWAQARLNFEEYIKTNLNKKGSSKHLRFC